MNAAINAMQNSYNYQGDILVRVLNDEAGDIRVTEEADEIVISFEEIIVEALSANDAE